MRLVDIEPFEKQGHGCLMYVTEGGSLVQTITSALPTVDAEKVRHARWKRHPQAPAVGDLYVCSLCKMNVDNFEKRWFNYCPNCGATMDLEVSDG